jgi:hypothetical protein
VICGHIHKPELLMIEGIHYCNDGDWVESCSALVEHFDGRFELIHWLNPGTSIQETSSRHADRQRDRSLAPAG